MKKAIKRSLEQKRMLWSIYSTIRQFPKGSVGFCVVCNTVYEDGDMVNVETRGESQYALCLAGKHCANVQVVQTTMEDLEQQFEIESL